MLASVLNTIFRILPCRFAAGSQCLDSRGYATGLICACCLSRSAEWPFVLRRTPFCDDLFMAGRPPAGLAVVGTEELRARSYAKKDWGRAILRSAGR